ncbi:MAG: hypothetical protein WCP95_12465 [Actinomycetes bacterium]
MGTLLIATFVVLVVVTSGMAFASYRKHTRAAQARSRAALNVLLAEAYDLTAQEESVDEAEESQSAGGEESPADEAEPPGETVDP